MRSRDAIRRRRSEGRQHGVPGRVRGRGSAGTPDTEVEQHQRAESAATAKLAEDGHLVRLWRRPLAGDGTTAIGPYRADSEAALDGLLAALPLADRLRVTVTPLEAHPTTRRRPLDERPASRPFPDPGLPPRSHPGRTARPRRPRPGPPAHRAADRRDLCRARAEREAAPGLERRPPDHSPHGTALGDIRYTLETDEGDLLYVQSRSMRHGLCRTRRLQNRQLRTATNTKEAAITMRPYRRISLVKR
jgi:muconolactone D-isomerase